VGKGLERVKGLLLDRWERMGLKDKGFQRAPTASQEDLDEMFSVIQLIDAGMGPGDTTRAAVQLHKDFMAFFLRHVEVRCSLALRCRLVLRC